eukprot:1250295-Pyramimonas_sp.AAC.1
MQERAIHQLKKYDGKKLVSFQRFGEQLELETIQVQLHQLHVTLDEKVHFFINTLEGLNENAVPMQVHDKRYHTSKSGDAKLNLQELASRMLEGQIDIDCIMNMSGVSVAEAPHLDNFLKKRWE